MEKIDGRSVSHLSNMVNIGKTISYIEGVRATVSSEEILYDEKLSLGKLELMQSYYEGLFMQESRSANFTDSQSEQILNSYRRVENDKKSNK